MPRLAFIFRTDVHMADRGPVSWKADYPTEIYSSLEQIGELAREHKAKAVLDGGDFFHVKAASRNSHGLVVKAAAIQNGYPCDTYSIEGNHDVKYNNLGTIVEQPLGVLFESGVFKHLREEVFEDGDLRVRVVGMPYDPERKLEDLRAIQKQPGDTHLIALVHALAGENPPASVEDFFGEPVFRYPELVTENGPDVWCFGHWHKDQGIVEHSGKQFVNQGAVSRGALINENIQRTPQVTLIEADELSITTKILPLQVAPAEDVFDFERKERSEAEGRNIDEFITKLQMDATIDPDAEIEDNIRGLDFAAEVRDTALGYLSKARGEG